jgi:3-methylcrotonyl-CoA carboxylase alpha subunit
VFSKILIANRGEIACRIARTCERLGIAVAGVHSAADADALHVKTIGESVAIGGAAASESYLRIDAIIAAAKLTGAEAIHPGYGFLAENAGFARAVEQAGLVFIGPKPETIERLGEKAAAKQEAIAAGVPTLPGSAKASEEPAEIERNVHKLKLPVMLKAAAGGGGKGMRAISTIKGLAEEIESAMREARNAFGHAGIIVEKLVERGRHIEVQIAGDGEGKVVHLFERECSLQRRHQKVVEEAPAANLPAKLRERMLMDAVRLCERLRYRGLGTVEFILGGSAYYFLEINPRLQVEHPVTELVTGIDLVEMMLRIAAGEGLPFSQNDVTSRCYAVEARICAEDASNNFMPCTGKLAYVQFPEGAIRVEAGVESGSTITPYYDSLLVKLIAHASTRDEALDKLRNAIRETSIFGVRTNQAFLECLIDLPETRSATYFTGLVDEQIDRLVCPQDELDREALAAAAFFWMMQQRPRGASNPWHSREMTRWHMDCADNGLSPIPILHLESSGNSAEIRFAPAKADGSMLIGVGDENIRVKLEALQDGTFSAEVGLRREIIRIHCSGDQIFLRDSRRTHALTAIAYLNFVGRVEETSAELRAPMTGLVSKVNVAVGDPIKSGEIAVVMESMKMEIRIRSEIDGLVVAVHCNVGDTVEREAVLVACKRE